MTTSHSDGESTNPKPQQDTTSTDSLESMYRIAMNTRPSLQGEIEIRGISFIGGYDEPRLSIITEDGYAFGVLTESQVALMVEEGAAWLRKRIQEK